MFHANLTYYFLAIARPRLTAVVVVWTMDIALTRILVSRPNCCAILGTSFAANITPSPSNAWDCIVRSPRSRSVVCMKVVKQIAMICLHQPVKPSVYPLGRLNMWSEPTAICVSKIPPHMMF